MKKTILLLFMAITAIGAYAQWKPISGTPQRDTVSGAYRVDYGADGVLYPATVQQLVDSTAAIRDSITGQLIKPFSEQFFFTFNGSNNVQRLAFTPKNIGETISLNGEVLQRGIDYYFTNDSLSIRASNITSGVEYAVEATYNIKSFPVRTGVVSFVFDDGKAADDTTAKVFRDFNFRCAFALVPSANQITYPYNARRLKYLDLQREGFEIQNHSSTHARFTDTMKVSTFNYQVVSCYDKLTNDGFHLTGFVTPYNVMYDGLVPLLRKQQRYAYTAPTQFLPNTSSLFYYGADIMKLTRVSMETGGVTVAMIKSHIDTIIANKAHCTFYAHALDTILTKAQLIEILTYVQQKVNAGVLQIMTPGDAIKKFYTYNY